MHSMLQIPEILLNIFSHLTPSDVSLVAYKRVNRDLAALARTCRAFKEPALDLLWSELNDPSPLSRCLPGISHSTVTRINAHGDSTKLYRFTRPLEQAEWDILRSYTRRVWRIRDTLYRPTLDWNFLADLTPPANLLFPNLQSLDYTFTEKIVPFLCLPFPSLIRLDVCLRSEHVDPSGMPRDPFRSLVRTSPKIRRLGIEDFTHAPTLSKIVSDSICGWSNLHVITCPRVALNMDALLHLSRMPTLSRLMCKLSDAILHETAPPHSPSSNWNHVELRAKSLVPVSRLLSWIRLPAITAFSVITDNCPSKQELALFMAGIQTTGMSQTIQKFDLQQYYSYPDTDAIPLHPDRAPDAPLLELNDLWSCVPFHNLRLMNIDLDWNVYLSSDQLLMLGSAWPWLEKFTINSNWGWNSLGGITPLGLAQLLEICPLLVSIALAIDTRGFTRLPAVQLRKTVAFSSFDGPLSINVVDSVIGHESIDAMAAFFCGVVPHFHFVLTYWDEWSRRPGRSRWDDSEDHSLRDCWEDVYSRANELIQKKWLGFLRQVIFQTRPRF